VVRRGETRRGPENQNEFESRLDPRAWALEAVVTKSARAFALWAGIAVVLVAVGSSTLSSGSLLQAEAAARRCSWQIDPHRFRAALYGLTAVSRRNVWAVGYTEAGEALALHWVGAGWKRVGVGSNRLGRLFAVAFSAANDGWAVGDGLGEPPDAINHWDGRRWIVIPSADVPEPRVVLWDVAALSRNDAWTVGLTAPAAAGGPGRALVEHWDGARWAVALTPDVGQSQLHAVVPISRDDVWAVGNRLAKTLIEHWDGNRWKVIPNPAAPLGYLADIAAISPRDIWVVGDNGSDRQNARPLLEHWDGAKWHRIAPPVRRGSLASVAALSTRDLWVSGGSVPHGVIVERRVGTTWRTAQPPRFSTQYVLRIAAAGKNDIWATGEIENPGNWNWAIEHFHC
jgi:hypothetical protein